MEISPLYSKEQEKRIKEAGLDLDMFYLLKAARKVKNKMRIS